MRMKLIVLLILTSILSGCGGNTIEASLRVPELPEEVIEFNGQLSKIKSSGMESIAPSGGINRQSVQLFDIDGDGIDEGISFFKDAHSAYAYIFKKADDGYEQYAKIEGIGNAVESVAYADLLGSGNNDIVIGWSVSDSDARAITVHSVIDGEVRKICETTCLYYLTYDINGDMINDLCVFCEEPDTGRNKMTVYMQNDGNLEQVSSAPVSGKDEKTLRIRAANVTEGMPAVFVESELALSGIVTDVFIWGKNGIENITYSEDLGYSELTARDYQTLCEDIDNDGALEIPMLQTIAKTYRTDEGEPMPGVVWRGFNSNLRFNRKAYSFRAIGDSWYVTLPLDWEGKVVAVRDKTNGPQDTATFYEYRDNGDIKSLFSIITLTGDNREKQLEQFQYEKLLERKDVIYAVEIHAERYLGYDITAEMLAERFYYRDTEWSTGEVVF